MTASVAAPVRAVVVVPARDEQAWIGGCLEALAAQTIGRDAFSVIVVADACRDATSAVAARSAARLELSLEVVPGPGAGVGAARRIGMDLACARLHRVGTERGLIASTDADTRVAPDWLERQLAHVADGAEAIGGWVELDAEEAGRLPPGVLRGRAEAARARLDRVRRVDPDAAHHHFAGASMALTARAYRRIGGIEPRPALEDVGLRDRLTAHGIPVLRALDVRVQTSARLRGRAGCGLAVDLAAAVDAARADERAEAQ